MDAGIRGSIIVFNVPSPRNRREYPHIGLPYILATTIIDLHFAADNIGLSSLKLLRWAP